MRKWFTLLSLLLFFQIPVQSMYCQWICCNHPDAGDTTTSCASEKKNPAHTCPHAKKGVEEKKNKPTINPEVNSKHVCFCTHTVNESQTFDASFRLSTLHETIDTHNTISIPLYTIHKAQSFSRAGHSPPGEPTISLNKTILRL